MRLYEINATLLDVIERAYSVDEETGEILFDEADLEALDVERTKKLEGCACYLKDLQAQAAAIKAERDALSERLKSKQREAERMSAYILQSMQTFGDAKLETTRATMRARKSKAVEVYDMDALPDIYTTQKLSVQPNKVAIRKALADGHEVTGAGLVERVSLIVK